MDRFDKNLLQNPMDLAQRIAACEQEIQKGMIGQQEIIRQVMIAMLTGGNVLLEGMPGLGKTRLVSTIAKVFDLSFKRIQFTPDLLPSDVTGLSFFNQRKVRLLSRRGLYLRIFYWRMRSTARRPGHSQVCWNAWRRGR